jgi:hypothetical protein
MNELRWHSLACGLLLVQCGGRLESGSESVAVVGESGGTESRGGNANGGASGCAGTSGLGAAAGKLSAYEELRSACRLDVRSNPRSGPGGFTTK